MVGGAQRAQPVPRSPSGRPSIGDFARSHKRKRKGRQGSRKDGTLALIITIHHSLLAKDSNTRASHLLHLLHHYYPLDHL